MVTEKTAKPVTLRQLAEFIKTNLHLTWYLGEGGPFSTEGRDRGGWSAVKYIYPKLDTRTMEVWAIETDKFVVTHTDEFEGTILDLLLHKINEYRKEWDK